jgi:hypothetical protein
MSEKRTIIVNFLPQSGEAWFAIAIAVIFLSGAMCIQGCWDAMARETEAKAMLGKAATEMVKKP